MTQSQIVQTLAGKCEITKKVASTMMTALAQTAINEVKKNGVFVVPGLGRLVRVDRKARMGRNPATGEAIKIAAKKVVKFRVAKAAKEATSRQNTTLSERMADPPSTLSCGRFGNCRQVFWRESIN